MKFSSWKEVVQHLKENYSFSSPDELWNWENFSDQILSLRNRLGFGDEIEFLGYRVTDEGILIDDLREFEEDLSTGMMCALTYYSLSESVENQVDERRDEWVNFWQLPGGEAKETAFRRGIVSRIGKQFIPDPVGLESAAERLGGEVEEGGRVVVPTLPEIELMVNVTQRSGEFPSSCSVYFQRRAANYLPTDNLNDMGTLLARRLEAAASPEVVEL